MSGHSKWKQIKQHKGAADVKKSAVFTKLSNAITVAARSGGGNPDFNFTLRLAIDKAKLANMPKDNIERAIKRGTGELEGVHVEEILYEGFGPEKVAVIVHALTDNKNRTVSELKHLFAKYHGALGNPNSVMWLFEKKGVIRMSTEDVNQDTREKIELLAIDAGALDMKEENDLLIFTTEPEQLKRVQDSLSQYAAKIESANLEYLPKETRTLQNPEEKQALESFLNEIEDLEEVHEYYTNAG